MLYDGKMIGIKEDAKKELEEMIFTRLERMDNFVMTREVFEAH